MSTEAAFRFSNIANAVDHATNTYGYLSAAGGGKKQITLLGEAIVEALPDREKVTAAIAEHKTPKRSAKKQKKKK